MREREKTLAAAAHRIRHLIVILEKCDEPSRRVVERWTAASSSLPLVALPLEQEPPLRKRQKLLRRAADAVLAGKPVALDQLPSVGCNIKWKPGNEPDYFGKLS